MTSRHVSSSITSAGALPQAAEADALVAEQSGLDHVEDLLDDATLSSWLGFPVQGRHVRIKPGHSATMAWERTDAGPDDVMDTAAVPRHGWTVVSRDTDKYAKAQTRAEQVGESLRIHQGSPLYVVSGSVWADRVLGRELAEARGALGGEAPWRILRYNPRRRVVAVVEVEGRRRAVRVEGRNVADQLATAVRWRQLGLPAGRMHPLGQRGTALVAPLWGHDDLLGDPCAPAAENAGRVFATLHSGSPEVGKNSSRVLTADVAQAARAVSLAAPWLGERATLLGQRLSRRMAGLRGKDVGGLVELHGDLSPDQVLLAAQGSHKIRVIDLDRAGLGPAMRDVGSWVAACRAAEVLPLAEEFLKGYSRVAPVSEEAMRVWECYAHLAAAMDPFRRREANWPEGTLRRLVMAEQALDL